MDNEFEKYKSKSISLCQRLVAKLKENQDDAALFFGGEIYKVYRNATEKAISEAVKVRTNIYNK